MSNALEELQRLSKENSRVVKINVGVLKSALREINSHVAVNGKGIMTDMVVNALESAIERSL